MNIKNIIKESIKEALSFSEPKDPKQEKEMIKLLTMMSQNRSLEPGGWKRGAQEALEKAKHGDWSEATMFLRAYIPQILKRKKN